MLDSPGVTPIPLRAWVMMGFCVLAGFFIGGYTAKYNNEVANRREISRAPRSGERILLEDYGVDVSRVPRQSGSVAKRPKDHV